jgi:Mg2+-importing ATPase
VAAGIFLPLSPLAGVLGFDPLPVPFFLTVLGMILVYMVLVEFAKKWFFARAAQQPPGPATPARRRPDTHHISRRASRFSAPVVAVVPGRPARRRRKVTAYDE